MPPLAPTTATSSPIGQTWHFVEQTISTAQQQLEIRAEEAWQNIQRFCKIVANLAGQLAALLRPGFTFPPAGQDAAIALTRDVSSKEQLIAARDKLEQTLVGFNIASTFTFGIFSLLAVDKTKQVIVELAKIKEILRIEHNVL